MHPPATSRMTFRAGGKLAHNFFRPREGAAERRTPPWKTKAPSLYRFHAAAPPAAASRITPRITSRMTFRASGKHAHNSFRPRKGAVARRTPPWKAKAPSLYRFHAAGPPAAASRITPRITSRMTFCASGKHTHNFFRPREGAIERRLRV